MTSSVNVSDVEDRNCSFDVVDHFDDFLKASPQFLSSRGFNTNLGWCAVLNPWEDGEFILIIMPDVVDSLDNVGEDVGGTI